MLRITVPETELYDSDRNLFITVKEQTLQLEHSLLSISKWESKWHKAFLGKKEKTREELIDYIRCMTLTQNVDPQIYTCLTQSNINEITEYISSPMTATAFCDDKKQAGKDTMTSELIYYWMITFGIPFGCEKWHLNRLLTLIHVCSVKNTPPKKMSQSEILARNKAINAANRARFNTRG